MGATLSEQTIMAPEAHAGPGRTPPARGEGARLPRAMLVALLLISAAVLAIQLEVAVRRPGRGLMSFDSAEYAVAGREFARTGRLATPFVLPSMIRGPAHPPFPLLLGHPLVPAVEAVLFRLGGARPALTLVPPALAFLAVVWLAALLALRASGSAGAGFAAGLALAFAPGALDFASDGLTELPFTAFWLLALLLIAELPERPRPAALGIVLGLAHLTRPVLGPLLPVWLCGIGILAPGGRRSRTVGIALAAFAPFAIALYALHHAPGQGGLAEPGPIMLLSGLRPDFTPERIVCMTDLPQPWAYVAAHPGALVRKALGSASALLSAALGLGSPAVLLLFVLHLVAPAARAGERRFRGLLVALWLALFALACVTLPSVRFLFPMQAAVFALAVAESHRLARARGLSSRLAVAGSLAVALLVSAYPTAVEWRGAWRAPANSGAVFSESEWRALGARLSHALPPETIVASDAAPWVAWYGDRAAVQLPAAPDELSALTRHLRFEAIVLTNQWAIWLPWNAPWRSVWRHESMPPGWMLADSVSAGRLHAFVLRRGVASGAPRGTPH